MVLKGGGREACESYSVCVGCCTLAIEMLHREHALAVTVSQDVVWQWAALHARFPACLRQDVTSGAGVVMCCCMVGRSRLAQGVPLVLVREGQGAPSQITPLPQECSGQAGVRMRSTGSHPRSPRSAYTVSGQVASCSRSFVAPSAYGYHTPTPRYQRPSDVAIHAAATSIRVQVISRHQATQPSSRSSP